MDMACRVSQGFFPVNVFKILTCSLCYEYLLLDNAQFKRFSISLVAKNGSGLPMGTYIHPDINNASTTVDVCNTMEDDMCEHWLSCCRNAMSCCERQLSMNSNFTTPGHCPKTWDGFSCFDEAKAGERVFISCPSYIKHAVPGARAYKDCTKNATWFANYYGPYRQEWTNYSTCIEMKDQQTLVYVGFACSLISVILLVISCVIFIAFRQLRVQQRIRIHVSLFVSFIITAIIITLWNFLVYYDRLEKAATPEESRLYQNSGGCKLLYTLMRYAQTSNYFWMFCEGFYLHRLIVHAFEVPKTLIGYYIYGWGVPWIPVVIYSSIRAATPEFDKRCWVDHAGAFEYLIYVPNLLSILANIFFFVNILRILLTQLQSHPNEPSNYRRAFRATFVLVPLFGIQWVLLIYRPEKSSSVIFVYEIVRSVVQNSQGAIVALIFCIFNGEVHTHLKNLIRKRWPNTMNGTDTRFNSVTSTTQYTYVPTGSVRKSPRLHESQDHQNYIPLDTVPDDRTKHNGHVTFDDQSPSYDKDRI